MALTKISRSLLDTGISDSSDATAITINSSEQVGIGETSPAGKLHIKGTDVGASPVSTGNQLVLEDTENGMSILSSTSGAGYIAFGDSGDNFKGGFIYDHSADAMRHLANGSEAMRINSNGTFMVGTTSNPSYPHKIYAVGSSIPDGIVHFRDTDTTVALSNAIMSLQFSGDNDATNGYFIYMTDGNGAIGAIQAASGTSVSYGTSSDERLKKNIVDASSQLDMLKSVKVREFDWKRNDHHELGLIAQEIKDIIPNVVQQGGDDETKNPWSVDYGKLTPYLLKALQEQQTIIEDLKSRIETLEG